MDLKPLCKCFSFYFPLQKVSQDPYDVRKSHLSPPISARGLSDSDMSELDFDDGIGVVSGGCLCNVEIYCVIYVCTCMCLCYVPI